jgi:ABC-type Fe3+/spermidine/putrescine transport system ATPase subunit
MVAIRPEKLTLTLEPPGGDTNVVRARIGPAAYLGDRSHYHVYLEGREQPVSVAVQNVEGRSADSLSADQPVWLRFSSKSVVLLEPE